MKSSAIKLIGAVGGYQVSRLLTRHQPKILMYHRFSRDKSSHSVCEATFDQQLTLVKKYFNPITLSGLAAAVKKNGKPPQHSVVITVDDGYRDFYEVAYPLLKHHNIPATFFVTTGFVNKDLWLWPDQVAWLLQNKSKDAKSSVRVAGTTINLAQESRSAWFQLIKIFLSIKNDDRLKGIKDLQSACAVALPDVVPDEYSASSWQQLEEMQENGIEIGGHTVSHPSLGHMNKEEAAWEISHSKKMLVDQLGERERSFCFPNGQPEDYSDTIKALVSAAGYCAAVTAFSDMHNADIPYAWRRFVGCEEPFQFHKSLYGVEHLGNRLRKTIRCVY